MRTSGELFLISLLPFTFSMANNRIRSQRKKFEHGNTHTQYDEETLKNSDLKVCRFVSKGGGHLKGLKTAQALKEI